MSNPAVLSLASMNAIEGFNYRFEIEDNIGEAIHIHYKDIRLDLTIKELNEIAEKMGPIINEIVNVEGFSYKDFDPVNLVGLAGVLPDLEKITCEEIFLEDLMVDTYDESGNEILKSIKDSRVVKALNGLTAENDFRKQVNYYSTDGSSRQTNMERLEFNLEKIKKEGYPVDGEYILLFNDSNRVYDGQHRASCLYFLNGNIKVKVRRLWFKEGRHTGDELNQNKEKEYVIDSDLSQIHISSKKRIRSIKVDMSDVSNLNQNYKVVTREGR